MTALATRTLTKRAGPAAPQGGVRGWRGAELGAHGRATHRDEDARRLKLRAERPAWERASPPAQAALEAPARTTASLAGAGWSFASAYVHAPRHLEGAASAPSARPAAPSPRSLGLQAKLKLSSPSDELEQEADRVADRMMRGSDAVAPTTPRPAPSPRAAGRSATRQLRHTKRTEDDEVKGKFRGAPPGITPAVESGLGALGSGQPLPASERAFFEPRFGHDFGRVRVHDGPRAAGVARALNARALTHGQDLIFASGEYAPGTGGGRHLLAHELAHVVQQGDRAAGVVQRDLATPEPAVAPPPQPDLSDEQVRQALAYNKLRFGFNRSSTRLIQDLVGTEPTGVWTEDDVRAVASIQEQFGLKKDGMVGDDTFRFLDREVSAERLSRADAHCLVSFYVLSEPPIIGPVVGGNRSITVRFTMHARFPEHCDCSDFEYRQFIRGHWRRERGGVVTDLGNTFSNFPGGAGLPAAWAEDGNTASAALNYGHRNQPAETINHYLDDTGTVDQANGCRYEGEDVPGGPDAVVAGDVFDIELQFRGEIRRAGRVVTTLQWTPLRGRFPVP